MEKLIIILTYIIPMFFAVPLIVNTKIGWDGDGLNALICIWFYPLTLMVLFGKYLGIIISEKID